MPRRDFNDARCLVTGASTGLGFALAGELARRGARVIIAARTRDRLESAAATLNAGVNRPDAAIPVVADITRTEDRHTLFEAVSQHFGGALDVVVNNAGVGAYGRFESHDESVLRRSMEINFFALAEVSRLALSCLRKGTQPVLVNIGSIVARRGLPGRSEYSAGKFAVAGFTESIRAEWSRDGIGVLLVNPGFTATDFEKNLLVDTSFYATTERRTMSAPQVAQAILWAVSRGKSEVTLSGRGRLLLLTNRFLPRFVDWGLGRWTRRLYNRSLGAQPTAGKQPTPRGADDP